MTDETTTAEATVTVTLDQRLNDLINALATDVNALTQNNNDARALLAADIAKIESQLAVLINDTSTASEKSTWSVDEITKYVTTQITTALAGLSPEVIAELQAISSGGSQLSAIMTAVAGAVRFDVDQTATITTAQAKQARSNIGAVSSEDVTEIVNNLTVKTGDVSFSGADLASVYLAARTVKHQ